MTDLEPLSRGDAYPSERAHQGVAGVEAWHHDTGGPSAAHTPWSAEHWHPTSTGAGIPAWIQVTRESSPGRVGARARSM